jgi:hypothetical protein
MRLRRNVAVGRCGERSLTKVLTMRILFVLALFAFTIECGAQDVIFRRVELPPPTTFAGLKQLRGPLPSGPCRFPSVSLSVDSLSPLALGDSATLRLPPGWRTSPPLPSDDERTRTRLTAPGDNRVLIERKRNGAVSRSFLMYRSGEHPEGTTCSLERGQTGAIWTFYLPDPEDTTGVRKYAALGSVITPAGLWYGVTLSTSSAEDQSRLAGILTEAMLLPSLPQAP